jgi:hypothetical protein
MLPEIGQDGFLPRLLAHIHEEIDAAVQRGPTRVVAGPNGQPNGIYHEGADGSAWRVHPSIFSAILLDRVIHGGGVIVDVDTYSRGEARQTGKAAKKVQQVAEHVETVGALIATLTCRSFISSWARAPVGSICTLRLLHQTSYSRSRMTPRSCPERLSFPASNTAAAPSGPSSSMCSSSATYVCRQRARAFASC